MKNVKTVKVKKYAVMKEKLLLLLLRQFISKTVIQRRKKTAEKKTFLLTKFKYCIIDH